MVVDSTALLTVTDLKQFTFCPRVTFYEQCLPDVRPRTYKMDAGLEAHEDERDRAARRTLHAYNLPAGERLFDLRVESLQLGLSGVIDEAILTAHEALVVDYKLTRHAGENHILQLAAYSLLLEEVTQLPVHRGYVYLMSQRRFEEVTISGVLRNSVVETISSIRQMVCQEKMPPPAKSRSKCIPCEFRRFCNDV